MEKEIKEKKLAELKTFFARDRFVAKNGIEIIDVTDTTVVCKAFIDESCLNAADSVQGGMLFTLADFTFAVLANSLHPITVTQSSSFTYLAACKDTAYIFAEAKEIACFKHNCVCEVTVFNDKGQATCVGQFNGFIK